MNRLCKEEEIYTLTVSTPSKTVQQIIKKYTVGSNIVICQI